MLGKEELSAEVRQVQKAAAVLACIQLTAEYDNEVEADLADAIAVVVAMISAVAARLDAESEESGGGRGTP
jgi:hypothetical protein